MSSNKDNVVSIDQSRVLGISEDAPVDSVQPTIVNEEAFKSIPFNKIEQSDKNIRKIRPKNDPDDKSFLENILAIGIQQNLIVYLSSESGKYGVAGGKRRTGALSYAVEQGLLSADVLVPCKVIDESEAIMVSLVENFQRKANHPADTFTAFNNMLVKENRSVADIAKQFGISEKEVKQYLRLGKVHKTIFSNFSKDKLSLDQMQAFSTTPDTKLQLAVYKQLSDGYHMSPDSITRHLRENRLNSNNYLVKFVGLDAYIAAKGEYEEDLFNDLVIVKNTVLLSELAQNKLDETAMNISGWRWIKTMFTQDSETIHSQRIPHTSEDTPVELVKRMEVLIKREAEIDGMDWDDRTDAIEEEEQTVRDEIEALESRIDTNHKIYDEASKSKSGCVVCINTESGEIELVKGVLNSSDIKANDKDSSKSSENDSHVTATKPEKATISNALASDLGLHRRNAIKAEMLKHPKLSIDLLHFDLCRKVLLPIEGRYRVCFYTSVSTDSVAVETSDQANADSAYHVSLVDARKKLDVAWMSHKTEIKQFEAYRLLTVAKKQSLLAYCSAMQLHSGEQAPRKDKFMDAFAVLMDIDFTQYFLPSVDNFFRRLTKPLLIETGGKVFGKKWMKDKDSKSKKDILTLFSTFYTASKDSLSEDELNTRSGWLPPEIKK